MLKIFADISNQFGQIVEFSSELADQGFYASNVNIPDRVSWKTNSDTSHYIIGTLVFGDDDSFAAPVDSVVILDHNIPSTATITLDIYTDLESAPNSSYTISWSEFLTIDLALTATLGHYWKLTITDTVAFELSISTILVGSSWAPSRGVDADSHEIGRNSLSKRLTLRNGSTFVQPTKSFRYHRITVKEMTDSDAFGFSDITFRYGKSTPIFVYLLNGTSLFTTSVYYGRLIEWSSLSPTSVSGNYKVSFTIEESK